MKLHFDPNQPFQHDAINSIVDIFEGQPLNQGDFSFSVGMEGHLFQDGGVGNRLDISDEQILKNLREVQSKNELPLSDKLDGMNFSVEMETGTGKTYVYLRTIYELNKKYGFKKFVIVVPSIAIREGVLKNLEITFEHFQNLYDKTPVSFDVYNSKRVSHLRNFAVNNNIQILVIPFWFKIKTPIGNYNPDWALIKKNEKTVYFVAETKSANQELRISEKRKIQCGHAHFKEFEDVTYKRVSSVGELD